MFYYSVNRIITFTLFGQLNPIHTLKRFLSELFHYYSADHAWVPPRKFCYSALSSFCVKGISELNLSWNTAYRVSDLLGILQSVQSNSIASRRCVLLPAKILYTFLVWGTR
jgi:hypothetical protein